MKPPVAKACFELFGVDLIAGNKKPTRTPFASWR